MFTPAHKANFSSRILVLFSTALLSLSFYGTCQAQTVYRWVDENGTVHFGDAPQNREADAITMETVPESPKPAPRAHNGLSEVDAALRIVQRSRALKEQARAEKAQAQAEAAALARDCTRYRAYLNDIKDGGIFYEYDEAGERQYLSDEQTRQTITRYEAEYQSYCQ